MSDEEFAVKQKLFSTHEIEELKKWLSDQGGSLPTKINELISRLLGFYQGFVRLIETNKSLKERMMEFMGIKPKSERGSQINQRWGNRR